MNKEPPLDEIQNQDIRRLLAKLLEKDPDKRIEVSEILKDPWVNAGGFDLVELDESSGSFFSSEFDNSQKRPE